MTYGVQPTGYVRKPLSVILAELEAAMVTEFGPGVIQTPQTPLGQINGLMADFAAGLWELAEDIYQSYDPDQAEGARLNTLARIRLLGRAIGESDSSFRKAITNEGQARIDLQDVERAIASIPGVTYRHVWVNDTGTTDENNMPPGSVALAVTGGNDDEIAAAIRRYIVPGITITGNTEVSSLLDGYCRSLRLLRPIEVPVNLTIKVRTFKDGAGCPPPNPAAIKAAFLAALPQNLLNGDDISFYRVRSVVESLFSNVEVVSINGRRDNINQIDNQPVVIAFIERAILSPENVTVMVVE